MSPTKETAEPRCPLDGSLAAHLLAGVPAPFAEALEKVGELSLRSGIAVWLVGGPVRDLVLGLGIKDLDLMVEGDGIAFAEALAETAGGRVVPYRRFGTALVVLPGGQNVDIAGARSERYPTPGSLPEVGPETAAGDFKRRDFSINAFGIRLGPDDPGRFADPHGGCADLREGRLRVLHDDSFRDDPTRILRAVRFEARFGLSLEEHTRVLLESAVTERLLDRVSRERIQQELAAILREPAFRSALQRIWECGIWTAVCGALPDPRGAQDQLDAGEGALVWYDGLSCRSGLPGAQAWLLRWILLAAPGGAAAVDITKNLKFSSQVIDTLRIITSRETSLRHFLERPYAGSDSALHGLLSDLPAECLLWLHAACAGPYAAGRLEHFLCDLRNVRPLVNGRDLLALGLPAGPAIGEMLDRLFQAQLDGAFTARGKAIEQARRLIAGPGSGGAPAGEGD